MESHWLLFRIRDIKLLSEQNKNTFSIDFEKGTIQLQKNVKPKGNQDSA